MNYKQLQYAILLSHTLNFSAAAEQIGISQPALSKQIIALEKDLGVELFDRSSSPLTLTPAGEVFIREARDVVFSEDRLRNSMEAFSSGERGRLVIGISPFRSLYLVPEMIARLTRQFPGLDVILDETNSYQLHQRAVEGHFDLAIMNLPVDEAQLDVISLDSEMRVLAVPSCLVPMIPVSENHGGFPIVDLSQCTDIPFITMVKGSEMRQLFDNLCVMADLHPKIVAEVVGIATTWALAKAGVGATLLPIQFLRNEGFSLGLSVYQLKQKAYMKHPVIVTKRGQYLSKYAQAAISILTQIWKSTEDKTAE